MDYIFEEDINLIGDSDYVKKMDSKSILITGATGLIGSTIVLGLLASKIKINIFALVRSEKKAKDIFQKYYKDKRLHIICGEIREKIDIKENIDYIIHAASATSSKYFVEKPVETIDIAINGTKNILEFAKNHQIESMVYLSSLEVYGIPYKDNLSVVEDNLGYIDFLKVRSSYSEGKRMVECLCSSYCEEYNVPVKIARLGQTMGPGVDYNDNRVFVQFARSCIEKKDIVLHTEGKTVRNYCYCRDAVLALLCILLNGKNQEAYNVVNQETTISIKNMAELLSTRYDGVNLKFELDNQNRGYNPEVIIGLNNNKLVSLGFKPNVGLLEMYDRMIESMKCRR